MNILVVYEDSKYVFRSKGTWEELVVVPKKILFCQIINEKY